MTLFEQPFAGSPHAMTAPASKLPELGFISRSIICAATPLSLLVNTADCSCCISSQYLCPTAAGACLAPLIASPNHFL